MDVEEWGCPKCLQQFDVYADLEDHLKDHMATPCLYELPGRRIKIANDGYARLYDNSTGQYAAAIRVLWKEKYGDIPEGFDVDHECHHILCLNWEHSRLLPAAENRAEASRKLTAEQVLEIRAKLEAGQSKGSLAREYSVTHMTITYIAQRKTWKSI